MLINISDVDGKDQLKKYCIVFFFIIFALMLIANIGLMSKRESNYAEEDKCKLNDKKSIKRKINIVMLSFTVLIVVLGISSLSIDENINDGTTKVIELSIYSFSILSFLILFVMAMIFIFVDDNSECNVSTIQNNNWIISLTMITTIFGAIATLDELYDILHDR